MSTSKPHVAWMQTKAAGISCTSHIRLWFRCMETAQLQKPPRSLSDVRNLGVLVDVTIYCQLYSRVERRDGIWRILTFDVVYEKDTAVPVYASDHFELNKKELEEGPAAYRFSAYNLKKIGYVVRSDDLYSDRSSRARCPTLS